MPHNEFPRSNRIAARHVNVKGPDWQKDRFPLPDCEQAVRGFLSRCTEGLAHERCEAQVRGASILTHIIKLEEWVFRENRQEHVEAILSAIDWINQLWPGAFRPARPLPSEHCHLGLTYWTMDFSAIWQLGRPIVGPSFTEIYESLRTRVAPPDSGAAWTARLGVFYEEQWRRIRSLRRPRPPEPKLSPEGLFRYFFSQMLLGNRSHWGDHAVISGYLYTHSIPLSPGVADSVYSTPDEVALMVAGVEKVNARWPGAFLPVRPAIPEPDDLGRILWLYTPRCMGTDPGRTDPTLEEVVHTALGAI